MPSLQKTGDPLHVETGPSSQNRRRSSLLPEDTKFLQIQGQFPAPHRRRGRGSPPPRGPRETPTPKRTATPCEDWRPRPPATRKNPSPELLELQGQGSATKQALPAASAQSRGVSVLLFLSHQNGCCRAAPRPLRFAPDAPRYWLALGAAQADWRV